MNQQAGTRITHVHTVGVPVTDQEEALELYVSKCGDDDRARSYARVGGGVPPMFYFRDPDCNRLLIIERA